MQRRHTTHVKSSVPATARSAYPSARGRSKKDDAMFAFLQFFRRRAVRPAIVVDEYYLPLRSRVVAAATLSPLDQMYGYYSAR